MVIDKLNIQNLGLLVGQHQQRINLAIVCLLSLYLIAFVADVVWRIIPEPPIPAQNQYTQASNNRSSTSNQSGQIDIRPLQGLNLFGEAQVEIAPVVQAEVTDAPETRLNLTLAGLVSSNVAESGAAIIEQNGKQNTYGVGEKIDGTQAILQRVQADRVILRNGVRSETLMLEGLDYDEANKERAKNRTQQQAKPANTRAISRNVTQQLRQKPDSFIDFINISPYRKQNRMLGYRVTPGKDPALFKAAGLKSGDVITEINGMDVTDPDQTMRAMSELRSAEAIQLSVSRNEETLTLLLELPNEME